MRVVWKDSSGHKNRPVNYRGYTAEGYGIGWVTNIPGDNNVYKTHYCALNAIDKALGERTRKGKAGDKRASYGITVIGEKDNVS